MTKQTNQNNESQKALAKSASQQLKDLLERDNVQQALKSIATKYLTPERITKMVLLAASRQPKLYECSAESLLKAAMTSAELGLECSGTLGRGYLVPFFNSKIQKMECQFIPGYQGLRDLAMRSGKIIKIEAHMVYTKDVFDYQLGSESFVHHKPSLDEDRGKPLCAYAFAQLKDSGEILLEIMSESEIRKIRNRSKAKDAGPWVTDTDEMRRKCPVRRLAKYLPLDTEEWEKALEADNTQFEGFDFAKAEILSGNERVAKKLAPPKQDEQPAPPEEKQTPQKETGRWQCEKGHTFDEPELDSDNMFGVCPECGSRNIKQIGEGRQDKTARV